MNDCPSCGAVMDCSDPITSYSIQSPLFPIVFVCPAGRDCTLGLGFHLVCCSQDIAIDFPAGFSQEQKQQIVNNAIEECQRQAQFCIIPPPPCPNPPCVIKVFWNDAQTCSAKCPDGSEFSYTVGAGIYLGTDLAIVNNLAYKQACNLAKDHKICLSALAGPYCAGSAQSFEIKATGKYLAVSPFSDYWSVSGTIPTGMTFHGGFRTDGKCVIDGTPTTAGTYTFTVTVTEQTPGPAFGDYTSRTYTIKINQITTASPLPAGTVGALYDITFAQSGLTAPITWAVESGTLPPGISLDPPTGDLLGTPTTAGVYTFTISATGS